MAVCGRARPEPKTSTHKNRGVFAQTPRRRPDSRHNKLLRWENEKRVFVEIEQAGIDFPELKRFTQRAGNGGKDQRCMTEALWDEQVALGARHGVFTSTTSWTGSAEAAEGFIEGAAPGKLAEAETEVGKSKIRKGRWVAQQTDCPPEVDDLYRQIVAAVDRELVDAPSPGESLSQPDGTVAR
jgi:hypothetical protein